MRPKTLSAGVIIIRKDDGACRFLLLRAFQYWDFPKGMVEAGEEPLEAAIRETGEEVGVPSLDFCWGTVYRETRPYAHGKVARYYVARTRQTSVELPVSPQLGRPEHHEYRWVGYAEGRSLLAPRVAPILDWAARLTGCEN